MTVSYSTNFMGPISKLWYEKRGLTEKKTRVVTEDNILVRAGKTKIGDVLEYYEITTNYAGGRIDIRGVPDEPWGLEYGLPVMHGEDWNALSDWLDDFSSQELVPYDELIELFEEHYGKKIRWADEIFPK